MTKMTTYNQISNALTSLAGSTVRSISLREETWDFDGLNSPYVSHKGVSLGFGHGCHKLVVLSNNRYTLFVTGLNESDLKNRFGGPVSWAPLPAYHIRDLLMFPADPPKWLNTFGARVMVGIIDPFHGFDEQGSPLFIGEIDQVIEHLPLYSKERVKIHDPLRKVGYIPGHGDVLLAPDQSGVMVGEKIFRDNGVPFKLSDDYPSGRLDDIVAPITNKEVVCVGISACEPGKPASCSECPHNGYYLWQPIELRVGASS